MRSPVYGRRRPRPLAALSSAATDTGAHWSPGVCPALYTTAGLFTKAVVPSDILTSSTRKLQIPRTLVTTSRPLSARRPSPGGHRHLTVVSAPCALQATEGAEHLPRGPSRLPVHPLGRRGPSGHAVAPVPSLPGSWPPLVTAWFAAAPGNSAEGRAGLFSTPTVTMVSLSNAWI